MVGEYWRKIQEEKVLMEKEHLEEEARKEHKRIETPPRSSRQLALGEKNAQQNELCRRIVPIVHGIFKDIERNDPRILSSKEHKLILNETFPIARVSWGEKFDFTDEDRQVIEEYRKQSGKLFFKPSKFPEYIVECDFWSIGADFRKQDAGLFGHPYIYYKEYSLIIQNRIIRYLESVVENPQLLYPAVVDALDHPNHIRSSRLRSNDYYHSAGSDGGTYETHRPD